jgi:hypothetical protein
MWRARSGDRHDQILLLCSVWRPARSISTCVWSGQGQALCLPWATTGGCPYRLLSLYIQSIDKRGDLRSNAVLGLQTGTIGEILIAPVSSVRSLPVGPRARFDL